MWPANYPYCTFIVVVLPSLSVTVNVIVPASGGQGRLTENVPSGFTVALPEAAPLISTVIPPIEPLSVIWPPIVITSPFVVITGSVMPGLPLPLPLPDPAALPLPDPTPEPLPLPAPTPDPLPLPAAEPLPEPTAEPLPEPAAEPLPEPAAKPLPEPTAEPLPLPELLPTPLPDASASPPPVPEPVRLVKY